MTGGAGFIGSHICEALVARGDEVIIIDNVSSGKLDNINKVIGNRQVTFAEGTITDLLFLRKIFKEADGVFHQAALVTVPGSIEHPIANHDINMTGTFNVLIAARDTSIRKVVCASSAAVYGNLPGLPKREDMPVDPQSPYAFAKLAGEYYCRLFSELYGLRTTSLRYFNVYGPRQDPDSDYAAAIPKFIQRVRNCQPPVIYGDGEQTRDFVFVNDVVQANLKAMESNAQGVFNVANGIRTSVNELAGLIMKVSGKTESIIYEKGRQGEVKHSVADITKAREGFGFEPTYTLEKGLASMFCDHGTLQGNE